MTRPYRSETLILSFLVLASASTHYSHGSESLTPSSVAQQYLDGLAELKKFTSNLTLEGSFATKVIRAESLNPILTSKIDLIPENLVYKHLYYFKSDGRSTLNGFPLGGAASENRLIVVSPTGDFVLRKKTSDANYYLEFTKLSRSFTNSVDNFKQDIALKPHTIAAVDASEMLAEDGRFIKSVLRNDDAIRIEFSRPASTTIPHSLSGWVVVDPTRKWAIREYQVDKGFVDKEKAPYTEYSKVSYTDDRTLPTPAEIYVRDNLQGGSALVVGFKASKWSNDPVSSDVFLLEAYGLGMVNRGRFSPSRGFAFWAIGFGILALTLGAVLKYRRSTRAA